MKRIILLAVFALSLVSAEAGEEKTQIEKAKVVLTDKDAIEAAAQYVAIGADHIMISHPLTFDEPQPHKWEIKATFYSK